MRSSDHSLAGTRAVRAMMGFTLIELMITVAVIAIIAAVAYPSYQSHVTRTHRDMAKACLSEHVHFMERYYTTNLTYVGAAPNLGCSNADGLGQRYTFTVTNLARSTYNVSAAPVGTQASNDAQCGTLGMNQAGTRSASGPKGAAGCW
jgi:type IV pilus assembly protein PilE